MTPFAELVLLTYQTQIAPEITFQSKAPRGLICFGSKCGSYLLGFWYAPKPQAGTWRLLRGPRILFSFTPGLPRLPGQVWARQLNHSVQDGRNGAAHCFQPSHLTRPRNGLGNRLSFKGRLGMKT